MQFILTGMKIAFVAFVVAAALTQTTVLADGNTGTLRGAVRRYDTATPIRNARVYWVNPSGIGSTTTDAQGRFYFLDVVPGRTVIGLSAAGFNANCLDGVVHANETLDIVVALAPATRGNLFRCRDLHATGHEAVEDGLSKHGT